MSLSAGARLGPYEIIAPLGAGGMGEVFKARDTRLERSVAIKVLPADFANNAQLKIRFEREAKTISQLNHPHICTLYDVGEGYLVMELLEGETLADRIAKGPLPLDQVFRYGVEIADALDKAHKAGVVHRDLKPGNIMITKSGAKLLDFGLAKAQPVIDADGATQHKPLTKEGTLLGTFQYMAPEQLEGAEADARTDIFAFGVVLYEMASGKRAFEGKTKTSLIAAIVNGQPEPLRQIQPLTPPALEHVIAKCLSKDQDDRWQSAHDIAEELKWIREAGSQAGVPAPLIARRKSRERLGWIAALVIAAGIAGFAGLRAPRKEPVIMASIPQPLHAPFDFMAYAALSPDGNSIAFIGYQKSGSTLWVRPLDRLEPKMLPSTEGAQGPFWSPDGKSLGFFAGDKLKRISVAGGPPQTLCDAAGPWPGGSWSKDGVILFSSSATDSLHRIPAAGGLPQAITRLDPKDEAHRYPVFLPDGDHFVFLVDAARTENHHIRVGSLRDGSMHEVMQAVTNAVYADPSQFLFVRGGALLAQAFDAKTFALRGEPRLLAENVVESGGNHHYEFSVSGNGRLIYRSASSDTQLIWVDRTGKALGTLGAPRRLASIAISPDQRHFAIGGVDADGRQDDIWVLDDRGVASRFTFDPASDGAPVWSPDGSRIAFGSARASDADTFVAPVSDPARVEKIAPNAYPIDWSPDGRFLLLEYDKPLDIDVMLYSFETHEVRPYLNSPFIDVLARFSPDGRSVAYVSDQSGHREVYVESFPSHANRRQVSIGGGEEPRWGADGKEVFYVSPDLMLMSVDMKSGSEPKPLFHLPGFNYAPARDGRFLVDRRVDDFLKVPLTLVSNWKAQ